MELIFKQPAEEDLNFYRKINDTKTIKKIESLLKSIVDTPKTGLGKPEPLKGDYSGL